MVCLLSTQIENQINYIVFTLLTSWFSFTEGFWNSTKEMIWDRKAFVEPRINAIKGLTTLDILISCRFVRILLDKIVILRRCRWNHLTFLFKSSNHQIRIFGECVRIHWNQTSSFNKNKKLNNRSMASFCFSFSCIVMKLVNAVCKG
jgi:hypothetical protein